MNLHQENIFLTALEPSAFNYGLRIINFLLSKYKIYLIFSKSYLEKNNLLNHPNIKLVYDSDNLTVMGFFEVLSKLFLIRNVYKKIEKVIKKNKFKFCLTIDAWGFNKKLQDLFYSVQPSSKRYHFIAPKTWAWGSFRNKSLKVLNKLFCIFPFEENYFKKYSINAKYVGNPLLDIIDISKDFILEKEKYSKNKAVLMPGSRPQEIKNHLPFLLKFSNFLVKRGYKIYMPLSLNIKDMINQYNIPNYINLSFGNSIEILKQATFGVIASGTASLEAALCGVPHIVIYKLNPFTYFLGRLLVKLPYISLVNILLEKKLIKEHIQNLNLDKLKKDFLSLEKNRKYYLYQFLNLYKILKYGCFENLKKELLL